MKNYEYGVKPALTQLCLGIALASLIGCGGGSGSGNKSSSSAPASSSPASSLAASSEAEVSSSSSLVASASSASSLSMTASSSSLVASSSSLASEVMTSSSASSTLVIVYSSSSLMSSSSSSSSEVTASSSSSSIESSSSSSSSSSSAPSWTLVWSDEFDGTDIDPAKWGYEKNCWGGGNNEQQCYTDQASNAFVADGVLNIVAVKEDFTGPNTPEGDGNTTATLPYTSARLRTKNLQEWTFGRFVIRAKLPSGQGTWPAIWMLPTNSPYGTWASSGEIDIMEAVNLETVTDSNPPETRVYGTLHYGRNWPGNVSSGADYVLPNNASPADDFHEYALEWEAGEIRWYVDGVHFATQRDTGWYSQYVSGGVLTDAPVGAPFDSESEYHLLLNLAVGGAWAGATNNTGIDASVFPQTMQVDYVRVYQCEGAPAETGIGCATIGADAELVPGNTRPAIGEVELPGPPLFVMYGDDLASGLKFNSYNPDGVVSYSEVTEAGRGDVVNVVKTGNNGNVYFEVNGDPTDLTNWSSDSELIFDVKVNSNPVGSNLLVKIDSGWPNVSDFTVPVDADGVWKEIRITLADLKDNGNSLAGGMANLASIKNTFVIDSNGPIDVSFDNVRIEGEESDGDDVFAPLPLFTVYGDNVGSGLQVQTYTTAGGQIATSEVADDVDHGQVFKLEKTGTVGSAFFNIAGGANLSHWGATGTLTFDVKVISKAPDATLLVKMDSGWPNVSDVTVTLPAEGVWGTFSIDVADLIDNGNRFASGSANLSNISNIFVMEPSDSMEVVFDNIRFEGEAAANVFAPLPLFTMYGNSVASGLQVQSYNPVGAITSSEVADDVDHGQVFHVVKTSNAGGNVFFNVTGGAVDLSHWSATGKLIFDVKVNSKASGAILLVKMDSGWPFVSDMTVDQPADGVWRTVSIDVADLLALDNSYAPGNWASIANIANIFVMEPNDAMDVMFDNVRLEIE